MIKSIGFGSWRLFALVVLLIIFVFVVRFVYTPQRELSVRQAAINLRPSNDSIVMLYKHGRYNEIYRQFADTKDVQLSEVENQFSRLRTVMGAPLKYKYRGFSATGEKNEGYYELNIMYDISVENGDIYQVYLVYLGETFSTMNGLRLVSFEALDNQGRHHAEVLLDLR